MVASAIPCRGVKYGSGLRLHSIFKRLTFVKALDAHLRLKWEALQLVVVEGLLLIAHELRENSPGLQNAEAILGNFDTQNNQ